VCCAGRYLTRTPRRAIMNVPGDTHDPSLEAASEEEEDNPAWEALSFKEPDHNYGDQPPPQLVRTVNLLPVPAHDLRGGGDVDGIATFILHRARQGIADVFAHEDYAGYEREPTEAWARVIAEHQTGIPDTRPARFYGGQKEMVERIVAEGRYPLAGQCHH